MAGRSRPRARASERYLPLAYFALAILVVALVLPSALRPPAQQSNQSAELSPNAPKQQTQSIISALSVANSGTQGAGVGTGPGSAPGNGAPVEAVSLPKQAPRACPNGYGNPPRQVASVYAAPCATAWSGNNGGATAPGVTASTVGVALLGESAEGQAQSAGPIPSQPSPTMTAATRTYVDLQAYFNRNFQFYGRSMQLYETRAANSENGQITAADAAADTYHAFAGFAHDPSGVRELARRGLAAWASFDMAYSWLAGSEAYMWNMDGLLKQKLAAEFLCKKIVGKPPQYNEHQDPNFNYSKPRILGLIYYDTDGWTDPPTTIESALKADCGAEFKVTVGYDIQPGAGQSQGASNISTAIAKLRAGGVTTVAYLGEYVSLAAFTNSASSQGYFPEWFTPGVGLTDINADAQDEDPAQWRHAFGFSAWEIPEPQASNECYKAVASVDPGFNPDANVCGQYTWPTLLEIANGIQMAGPHLTSAAFRQGLYKMGFKEPSPAWSMGGGFGPGIYSWAKYVAEIWWNPNAVDPKTGNPGGAYCYDYGGQRFQLGQFTTDTSQLFNAKDCVTTVPYGAQ
ncbi:MAG TPA: hypothetical protein VE990_14680 [Acidimicrobiales bacterium]|nr:hypothetical protein [Acidimicrobiales bacterium]